MPLAPLTIAPPTSEDGWIVARTLVGEYVGSLSVDLAFQGIDAELARLSDEYGPPRGRFLIARVDGLAIGCVGLRPFPEADCEMKRLYVRPAGRGRGAGRALADAIIGEARRLGYRRMLLDTLPDMAGAQALYRQLGFVAIAPYRFNPVPGTVYMSMTLRA